MTQIRGIPKGPLGALLLALLLALVTGSVTLATDAEDYLAHRDRVDTAYLDVLGLAQGSEWRNDALVILRDAVYQVEANPPAACYADRYVFDLVGLRAFLEFLAYETDEVAAEAFGRFAAVVYDVAATVPVTC